MSLNVKVGLKPAVGRVHSSGFGRYVVTWYPCICITEDHATVILDVVEIGNDSLDHYAVLLTCPEEIINYCNVTER